MNSQEYWRRRVLYAKQKELDAVDDYEDAMRSRLKDLQNEINKEASVFVNRYAETNEISKEAATKILSSIDSTKWNMTLEEFKAKAKVGGYEKELDSEYFKSRIARLQSLHDQLADFASKYANSETGNMAVALAKRYNDTYLLENYNKYLVVGGLDIDLAHFNEQQLKDIVYQPWRGSNFSKRIWENYTKVMPDVLTDVLLRSTLMGYNWQRTQRMIEDRFAGIEQKQLHRLVITEMGHAAEQATAKFYEDSKIDQYQYLATLESHTCDVCAHLDERIFYVKDKVVGLNYPLIHPYCRCTTCGYIEGLPDITSRWSRDPMTGKGRWVKDQPYSQWARSNGQKPYSFNEWKRINGIKPLQLGMLKALPAPKVKKKVYPAIKNFKDYSTAMQNLGFKEIQAMNGLKPEIYQKIYNTVSDNFEAHPELKGFLTLNKGGNRKSSADLAYIQWHMPNTNGGTTQQDARFSIYSELNINKAAVKDTKELDDTIREAVHDHWWSKKSDFTGLINHEMAHAIANRAEYTRMFGYNIRKDLTYIEGKRYARARKNKAFEEEVLLDAFKEFDPKYENADNVTTNVVQKYISEYGSKKVGEAFAEAYSDESNSKFSQIFHAVLNRKLGEIYGNNGNT